MKRRTSTITKTLAEVRAHDERVHDLIDGHGDKTKGLRTALEQIHAFCEERRTLCYEDHGDEFAKLADIAKGALE